LYSVSGNFELPSDKKSAEFSKNNWGDYLLSNPRGDKTIKRATVFLRTIKQLKTQQWNDIFSVAVAFNAISKQSVKVEEEASETESEEDLVDPRYENDPPSGSEGSVSG
jgi:hypothetical protein